MVELARGNVADRPWGRTLATLGLRGVTGQLTVVADAKRFLVGFDQGAVVAAWSPLASDAAVRVAVTSHLVSSSQVPEISRRQAMTPDRDEVDLVAELARLGPDHALRLRRRVIAQRAARTFSINQGEFVVTDRSDLEVLAGCELDVRAVVYLGARVNLSEQRLAAELVQLGAWFQLKPGVDDDLPQFGFTDVEQPVVERLRDGGTLAEIDAFASSFVDGRTIRAVIYALAACNACALEPAPGQPRSRVQRAGSPAPSAFDATQPIAPLSEATQPMPPMAESTEPAGRPMTQPMPRAAPPPLPQEPRAQRSAPGDSRPAMTAARPAAMPLGSASRPATLPPAVADAVIPSKTRTRISTAPPPPRSAVPPGALDPSSPGLRPTEEVFDAPTWRGEDDASDSSSASSGPRSGGDETMGWDTGGGSPRAQTREALKPSPASGPIRLPGDEALRPVPSSGPIGLPGDEALRPVPSSGPIRLPGDEALRPVPSSGPIRLPGDEALRRGGSSGSIRLPGDEALRDPAGATARRPGDDSRRRPSSSPGLRRPIERGEAGPGLMTRPVVASRPPPMRQVVRVDTPQSHTVKALIAQRLKLLDQGADHFQLLGVAPDAPGDALRKAYFALARQLHPDRLAALGISDDGKHAQRLFAQINTGFAILSDQGRRAKYLDVLRRGGEAAIRAEQARAEELAARILEAEEAFRRGELALRRDQPQSAVGELERAVQLNPDEADYHAALAWSRFCASSDRPGVAAATRTALDRAIQRSPRAINARFYLGRVERMLGRDQEALRHFRDVLAAVPGHTDAAAEIRALESRLTGGDKPSGIFGRPPPKR